MSTLAQALHGEFSPQVDVMCCCAPGVDTPNFAAPPKKRGFSPWEPGLLAPVDVARDTVDALSRRTPRFFPGGLGHRLVAHFLELLPLSWRLQLVRSTVSQFVDFSRVSGQDSYTLRRAK